MPRFSIVTTCKGRLEHLRQSLPIFSRRAAEVVVVDYDCPQKTRDFVASDFPGGKVVRSMTPRCSTWRGRAISGRLRRAANGSRSSMPTYCWCRISPSASRT